MFRYRPQRGSLEDAMKEEKGFITMDQMFDYIVKSDPFHVLQKEDLFISENLGKDDRIDWTESRYVLTKKYGKSVYDTPQAIGFCSMEDFYNPAYFAEAKNIHIGGISKHHLLKMLYDAAKPYDKTISIEEAVDALHNTLDTVTQLKDKKLYVNVFGKEFDGTEYDKINGIGLSYHVVGNMRYNQLFGKYPWEHGIPDFDGDHLDTLSTKDKVPETKPDAETNKEDKLEKIYKDVLKDKIGSILTIPIQNVYKVTCDVGLDTDFILIKAASETEAWDKFWEHFKGEPNLNHEDFGSKEDYEYSNGYWKRRGSIVSITIETINSASDFMYIGGGRIV